MDSLNDYKTAQEQYKRILDSISDCVVVTDASGVIRECNAASARWVKPSRQVVGMTVSEFMGDDSTPVRALFDRALQSGEPVSQEVLLAGGVFILDISPGVFDGAPALICVMKDVTEQKKSHAILYNSCRLSTIGKIVSGVVHEINNPLTGILGFAELLKVRTHDDKMLKDLDKLHRAAERCRTVVGGFQSFARQQSPNTQFDDINEIIDATIDLRTHWAKSRGLVIQRHFGKDMRTLVDRQQIQHALLQVLLNSEQAVEHGPRPGQIAFMTGHDAGGGHVVITVADNGIGILREDLERVFEPFFTRWAAPDAAGLGLTIARKIIADHGGDITLNSTAGIGTTVAVTLPLKTH